jgi:integrase/recombinase XerC
MPTPAATIVNPSLISVGGSMTLMFRLLWDNALRRNEICSLDVDDFADAGKLSIIGKGKLQKTQIDLSPATTIAISKWLAGRSDYLLSDPLFTSLDNRSPGHRLDGSSIYRLVRKFSEAAGIDKIVSPHRIRHSAITTYLDVSDGNLRAAQGLRDKQKMIYPASGGNLCCYPRVIANSS